MSDRQDVDPDWAGLIVAIAMRGDRAAFASLFRHFAPRVKAYMKRSGAADAAAEELAQETLLTVWRKAALFDPAGVSPSGWIFTIARNLRIDMARRDARHSTSGPAGAEFLPDSSEPADSLLGARQAEARVRKALGALSHEQRRVVELSYYEEKAHSEIAAILDVPLGTVKSRLRLAVGRLRRLLEEPE